MSLVKNRNEASPFAWVARVKGVGAEVRDNGRTDSFAAHGKKCGICSEYDEEPQEVLEWESDIFHWLKQVTWPHLTGRGSPAMYPEGQPELSGE